jgi:hypothetical protein
MIRKPWHGGVRANAGRGGGAPGREPYGGAGPQPASTTRSAAVSSATSATARTRGPCPAVIHSAVMTW